jgi:N-hydroxyarylamine O-acetyltransferase
MIRRRLRKADHVRGGFTTRSCLARAVINRDYLPPQLHRIPLVELDGRFLIADVGFGGPIPSSSFLLAEGVRSDSSGAEFRLSQDTQGWWLLEHRLKDSWQRLLLFDTQKQFDVDFVAPNYYCAHSPESVFVINRVVSLRTSTGSVRLFNGCLKHTENGVTTETSIEEPDELRKTLNSDFGISAVL